MNHFYLILAGFLFPYLSQAQYSNPEIRSRNLHMEKVINHIDELSQNRNFKNLPDSIRITTFFGNEINNSFKYNLKYESNRITEMNYHDGFNANIFKFNYDNQGRRTSAGKFILLNGNELTQGTLTYHYNDQGELILFKDNDGGSINRGDSLEIIRTGDKVTSYKKLFWDGAPNNRWVLERELYNVVYGSDKIVSYESKELKSGGGYNNFKYDELEDLELQKFNIFPDLPGFYNYDTSYFHSTIFSPYDAGARRLNFHIGGNIYRYDEINSTYIKIQANKIITNGAQSVVEILNPNDENEVYAVQTFNFNAENKLVAIVTENKINNVNSQEIFDYNSDGRLSKNAYLLDTGDTVYVSEYRYDYSAEGDLTSFDEFDRNGANINYRTLYQFSYSGTVARHPLNIETVLVYPNPANDFLYFDTKFPVQSVELFDINGKILATPDVISNALSVQKLVQGTYYLKVRTESGSFISKFNKI